jgi:Two component regulator propeller
LKTIAGFDKGGDAVLEDRDGNVWVATTCGVKRITHGGFVRYTQADGLASLGVNGIFTSHRSELFVISKQTVETQDKKPLDVHWLNRFDENRFTAVEPGLPPGISTGWGGGQIIVQDKAGEWWLPSGDYAVYRFRKTADLSQIANAKPQAMSIPDSVVFRIYEDSSGDM